MAELKGSKYYTVITDIGQAKIANSIYSGKKIDLTLLKLGDGNGEFYIPESSQTDVKKEVWRGNVVDVEIDPDNSNWINIYTVIAPTDGGFTIREMAVFDSEGDMIGICNCAESYKPTLDEGSGKEITMKMTLAVVNTSAITLKIDPTIIYAKRKDVLTLTTKVNNITAQLNAMAYEVAGGTATAITLNMQTLKNGYWKKFIASGDNNGAATTINGKPLYKVCSTNPPNLKANRPYEIYYNLSNDCFFLKASATGATSADKVLAGETFSTENDTDLVGTMPKRGAPTANLNCGGTYNIQPGYYSGGKVTANSLASQTSGTATASDIISGKTAWVNGSKITGNATLQSLGGCPVFTANIGVQYLSCGNRDYFIDRYALLRPYISEDILSKYSYAIVRLTGTVNGVKLSNNYYSVATGVIMPTSYGSEGAGKYEDRIVGYGTVSTPTSSTIKVQAVLYNLS